MVTRHFPFSSNATEASVAGAELADRRACLRWAAGLTGLALSACASKPKPASGAPGAAPGAVVQAPAPVVVAPTVLSGTVSAAALLNLSVSQRPSPLVVRLYELRSAAAFAKADFTALHQSDVATLGSELVLRDEFLLQPGESRPFQRTLAAETRFIGVFGVYRDIERAAWRASAAVQPGRTHSLVLRAEALALTLTVQP